MDALAPETWRRLLRRSPAEVALSPLYGPLLAASVAGDDGYVLGRLAQSLDGRIATTSGVSHWISGKDDIVHTHRLRALFDAVVIGAVLGTLAARGLRRIFVEGGGITVSRFLAAGALDRLHVTVAPLLIGSGIPAFTLPEAASLNEGLRLAWSVHHLGADLLFDIPLTRRPPAARS